MAELLFRYNQTYARLFEFFGRYAYLFGGAGSGKSYSIAQHLIRRCIQFPGEKVLTIRKIYRTCRQSTFSLYRRVLSDMNVPREWYVIKESEMIIEWANGSIILHAGLDDVEKLKSITDVSKIWIEEATEVAEADLSQLDLRLRGEDPPSPYQIVLSFNPIRRRHWLKAYVDEARKRKDCLVLHTTYRDNAFTGDEYRQVLRQMRDPAMRKIYLKGEWGDDMKGLVFTNWTELDDWDRVPEVAYLDSCIGLDFGFTAPTAVTSLYRDELDIYCRQELYRSHMTNSDLIRYMKAEVISDDDPLIPVICDAAEPQRIEEMVLAGINALPCDKDPKSFDSVKSYNLFLNGSALIDDFSSYKWAQNKDGVYIDRPVKDNDHGPDSVRYAIHTIWGIPAPRKLSTAYADV